jgi:hypothetical protein
MNHLKYLSCILLLLFTSRIYSQIPDTIWTKTFGGPLSDVGVSVKQTNDGGFIIAGTTSSFGAGGQDIWLIKTNENGDTLWTKTFGGTEDDKASNVQQTNNNGYAVFGTTNSFGNGGADFLLWKIDSLGNTEWFKTYGSIADERASEGHQLTDGTYILAGDSLGQIHKAWLVKTDENGNFIWGKTIGSDGFVGRSVQQINDGGYVICGTHAYLLFQTIVFEFFFSRISSNGTLISTLYYGSFLAAWGLTVKMLPDDNLILGGSVVTYDGTLERPIIFKTNQYCNILWADILSISQYPAILTSIETTNDNGFIFTAYAAMGQNISLFKCDQNGILIWEKIVGGSQDDQAYSINNTNDKGYIVTGYTKSFGAGNSDIWLLKFKYTPPDVQISFFPTVDTAWVFGGCTGPDIISYNLVSTSERDSITIEPGPSSVFFYYDSTGNTVPIDKYYFTVDDPFNQYDYELWFQPKSWPPFDPILIPFDSVFYFQQNSFDIKLIVKQNGVPIDSLSQLFRADWGLSVDDNRLVPETFSLSQNYPNPFNPSTKIKFAIPVQVRNNSRLVTLKVYDVLGNEIATLVNEEKQPGTYEVEFDESELPSGIYFYQLKAGIYIETKKMVLIK